MNTLKTTPLAATLMASMLTLTVTTHAAARSLDEVIQGNNQKLTTPWFDIKPGQPDRYGFTLSEDGRLSRMGMPLQPKIEVTDAEGRSSNRTSGVLISPLSPSGNHALLAACEPPGADTNFCWFQYLVDLKARKLSELPWAKYPQPSQVWWDQDENYAVVPVSQEGETWLTVIDIKKRENQDYHVNEFVQDPARPCQPGDDQYVIDLNTLEWRDNQIAFSVAMVCDRTRNPVAVAALIDPASGTLKSATASRKVSALPPQEMPREVPPPAPREVTPPRLGEGEIRDLVTEFYNTRSEWAGTFSLVAIRALRVEDLGGNQKRVHVDYKYAAVPGNRQGRRDVGHDQRTFDFQWRDGRWRVLRMGSHASGRP